MEKEFELKVNKSEKEPSLEEIASKYYADIPFHNFNHIKDVLKYAEKVMEECEQIGVVINKEVVRKALLFHDAGYHENHLDKGFKTKEEYSASIAEIELKKAGYSPEFIDEVKAAIMATMKDGEFSNNEQKIARISDISSMFGEYENFLDYNIRFKNEIKYINNKNFSWSEWRKAAKNIMEFYMNQDETMAIAGRRDKKGKTPFYNGLKRNLESFLGEEENALEQAQKEFEKNFYSKNNASEFINREAA